MAILAKTLQIHSLALLILISSSTILFQHAQGESIVAPCVITCGKKAVTCVVKCISTPDKCFQDCAVDIIRCMSSCLMPSAPPPTSMILDIDDSQDGASMERTSNFDMFRNPL
ncbi:hypothetical protein A4A49_65476, partial [Nicotiana attenuata]